MCIYSVFLKKVSLTARYVSKPIKIFGSIRNNFKYALQFFVISFKNFWLRFQPILNFFLPKKSTAVHYLLQQSR